MTFIAVVTTVATRNDAQALSRSIIERRLAACAQISEIESFYVWDGAMQNEAEFRVLFKTTHAHYAALEAAIRELHTYQLPAIHAFALENIDAPYAAWIAANVADAR